MQEITKRDVEILKGVTIILFLLYSLFSVNVKIMENYDCANFLLPTNIMKEMGTFCSVSIAMIMFLCGFHLDKYYSVISFDKKQIEKKVFSTYIKLLSEFFFIYVLVAATSFLGRSISSVYRTGVKTWIYAASDVLGLQWLLGTPTLNPTWVYLGLVVVYIFTAPFLIKLYRKYGWIIVMIAVFSPYILKVDNLFWNYLGVFMIGVWCAEEHILEKIKFYTYKENKTKTMYLKMMGSFTWIWLAECVRENVGLDRFVRCFLVLGIVYFSYEFISDVEIVGNIVGFLGKHSFNVWLVCDMLYLYYFKEQIFALHYSILIFAAILAGALSISIFLGFVKEKIGYNRMELEMDDNDYVSNVKNEEKKDASEVFEEVQLKEAESSTLSVNSIEVQEKKVSGVSGEDLVEKVVEIDKNQSNMPGAKFDFDKKDTMKMKGIAIGFLLFHHLFFSQPYVEAHGITTSLISLDTLSKIGTMARICVYIFTFLSAFGLTRQYERMVKIERKKTVQFFAKYWMSLMKPFWFVYLVCFTVSFILLGNPLEKVYGNLCYAGLDFMGISDLFGTPTLRGAWWYMCFAQIELLFIPLLVILAKKLGILLYPMVFICLQYLSSGITSSYGGAYKIYFLTIVMGVLCAEYGWFQRVAKKSRYMILRILEVCLYVGASALILWTCLKYGSADIDKLMLRSIGYSIVTVLLCMLGFKYFINRAVQSVLGFFGKHSATMFMIHGFIYTYYPQVVFWSRNVILSWATLMLISLIVALVIDKLYELFGTSVKKLYNKKRSDINLTIQVCRDVLNRAHIRVICMLHFGIGLCYILFRIISIHNMDTTIAYQVLDSSISESLERFLFIMISAIMGGILIYTFWKVVYIFCQKWDQIEGKDLFFACLIIGVAVIIVIYPGMYSYAVDNYSTYRYAMIIYPFYWHNAYTSYFYLACHMFLPHPIAIPLVQFTSFLLVLFYAYNMSCQDGNKKWSILYLLLLIVPEALYVALNPWRPCFYAILCMGLLIYIYFEFKQKRKLSRIKFVVLLAVFAFTAVWRSEGIIFSTILFAGLMFITYEQSLRRVMLELLLLLVCINVISIPQDLGSKKYWGSDYTLINCMNSLQSMLNTENINLQYEGVEDDLSAIEAVTPVEMIKKSGVWGYRNYNKACGRTINQSCASSDEQKAFLKAYVHITLNNLPIFIETKLQDYRKIILQEYPQKVSVYKGDYHVFPQGEFTVTYPGYEMIQNSYATKVWEMSSFRNALLSILDCLVYVYFWLGTKLKITVAVRIWFYVMFCICLVVDLVKSIVKRSKGHLYLFLIEATIFLEYCAIVLVMPEPWAAYFYPMQFCIYFMVLSKICEWLKSDEKQKRQKGIEEVKQEQCSTATH